MGRWAQGIMGLAGRPALLRGRSARFGQHARPLSEQMAELGLLGSAGALLGVLGWVLLAPLGPAQADGQTGLVVLDAPARADLFGQFDPFARNAGGSGAGANALPLTLLGTRSRADGVGGSAILAGADGVQHVVPVGQDAMPGVRLAEVSFDHVVLLRSGARVVLSLVPHDGQQNGEGMAADDAGKGGAPPPGATSPRFGLVNDGHDMALVLADDGGQATGLVSADRIVAIAGAKVTGPNDARRLETLLASGKAVAVTVRRDGRDLPLSLGSAGRAP